MPLAALAWLRALVAGLLQGAGTKLLLLIQICEAKRAFPFFENPENSRSFIARVCASGCPSAHAQTQCPSAKSRPSRYFVSSRHTPRFSRHRLAATMAA